MPAKTVTAAKAPTPAVPTPKATLEYLDPAQITVRNIRKTKADQETIDSIREFGVLQPIGVRRTDSGELVLRFGAGRRLACIEIGCDVPAIVIDGNAGTNKAEIDRIFEQLAENDIRRQLTAADRAGAVLELFERGVVEEDITRRSNLGMPQIKGAQKAAASQTARTLAAQYPLDIPQMAVIAEFDDDRDTAVMLAETARNEPAQFDHAAQRARDARENKAAIAAHAAKLTEQGITVGERLGWENDISNWAGADGRQLTPKNHKGCPGNLVALSRYTRKVEETWYCTDPRGNGHKKLVGSTGKPEPSKEEATAERRRVIANNKEWRSATTVRRNWLRDSLLARNNVPAGASLFVARALAAAEHHLTEALSSMSGGKHDVARELLGGIGKDTWDYKTQTSDSPLVDSLAGISEQRAQMITLALILGADEGLTADTETWRKPATAARDYLTALAGWGYTLSPIEQSVIDGTAYNAAAEVPADE